MTKKIRLKESYEQVLKAAAKLFRQKGFAATTVREIAQAAGILPGSLHYRYASKEEILLALMEKGIDQVIQSIDMAIGTNDDQIEKLRLALRAHMKLILSGDDAVYVLLNEWKMLTGEALTSAIALRDRYEKYWEDLLKAAASTGRFRSTVDIKLVRLLGFGAINWASQWYSSNGPYSPDEIADAFWNFMAFGVLTGNALNPK